MIGLQRRKSHCISPREGRRPWKRQAGLTGLVFIAALALILLQAPAPARAQQIMTAKVIELTGQVDLIEQNGDRRTVQEGDVVVPGQTIDSKADSGVVLLLEDGSQVEVFGSSRVEVNQLLPEEKSRFSVSLFFGRLTAKLRGLRGDDVVITPTMVAGVRGTAFDVSVADDGVSVVTVKEGTVKVITDEDGVPVSELDVKPGEEVQVDEPGQMLEARPVQLQDLEAFKAFREKRLDTMKEALPERVEELEARIDKNLESLEQTKAMPMDQAKVLEEIKTRMDELGPQDVAKRAQLIIEAHMETGSLLGIVQQFRRQRMRLNNVFVQSERLKDVLPTIAEPMGADYEKVTAGLDRIFERQKEVKEMELLIAKEFDESLSPVKPFLDQIKNKK